MGFGFFWALLKLLKKKSNERRAHIGTVTQNYCKKKFKRKSENTKKGTLQQLISNFTVRFESEESVS